MTFHSDTLISAWIVSAVLVAFAVSVRSLIRMRPGMLQSAVEMGAENVNGMLDERMGAKGRKYFPFVATLFLFIITSNWLGILPFELIIIPALQLVELVNAYAAFAHAAFCIGCRIAFLSSAAVFA